MRCTGFDQRRTHQLACDADAVELLVQELLADLPFGFEQVWRHGCQTRGRRVERQGQSVSMSQMQPGAAAPGEFSSAGHHPVAGHVERGSGDDILKLVVAHGGLLGSECGGHKLSSAAGI